MTRLTLYSKPGCHLCEAMKAVVDRVSQAMPIVVDEIDITTDAELNRRYEREIPVLLIDGRKAAKYCVTEADLIRQIHARS